MKKILFSAVTRLIRKTRQRYYWHRLLSSLLLIFFHAFFVSVLRHSEKFKYICNVIYEKSFNEKCIAQDLILFRCCLIFIKKGLYKHKFDDYKIKTKLQKNKIKYVPLYCKLWLFLRKMLAWKKACCLIVRKENKIKRSIYSRL